MKKQDLIILISAHYARSAWDKGVKKYALELLDNIEGDDVPSRKHLKETLLNGADDWSEYSLGGCSLIYDDDIIDRLCTPSEKKRYSRSQSGMANARETFIDVQARALSQAYRWIRNAIPWEV